MNNETDICLIHVNLIRLFTTLKITMSGGNVVPPLTTHVLDTARGIPGGGISMVLLIQTGNGEFREIERG